MKKSRFSEEQIIGILKEQEAGVPVAELCRKHGMSDASFYTWKAKYGGLDVSDIKTLSASGMFGSAVSSRIFAPLSFGTPGRARRMIWPRNAVSRG